MLSGWSWSLIFDCPYDMVEPQSSGGVAPGEGQRELQPPIGSHLPPCVGGNFGFLLEEIWQNDVQKLHFSHFIFPISAPLSEAPALRLKIAGATPASR